MKNLQAILLLLSVFPPVLFAQTTEYTGRVKILHKSQNSIERYNSNQLKLTLQPGGAAVVKISVSHAIGSKETIDKGYYARYSGTLNGSLSEIILQATGTLSVEIRDNEEDVNSTAEAEMKGSMNNGIISGTIYIDKQDFYSFSLTAAETLPELLFPLGNSPKVFDKGWLFGAVFSVIDEQGKETDLSDRIEWGGTAKFVPDKGNQSRPTFNSTGENKIILTVEHNGKKYTKEFSLQTVEANLYARVGSFAFCPSDIHGGGLSGSASKGGGSGPYAVNGPVITGNPNVLINGFPAACEGDAGIHVACDGPNTFTIADGDPEVLINGKKAAKLNSRTNHCGGVGAIVSLQSGETDLRVAGEVNFTKDGKPVQGNGSPEKGTNISTGNNGTALLLTGPKSLLVLAPSTRVVVNENTGNNFKLQLHEGSLVINSHDGESGKDLVIETDAEQLVKKGTRFIYSLTSKGSKLVVNEGTVEVLVKKENRTVLVTAGKVYSNDQSNPFTIRDTVSNESGELLGKLPTDSLRLEKPAIVEADGRISQRNLLNLLKEYWYAAAGIIVLLLFLVFARKKKNA